MARKPVNVIAIASMGPLHAAPSCRSVNQWLINTPSARI